MAMLYLNNQWLQIDTSDVWFWSTAWQIKERVSDEDIEAKRFQDFECIDDMFAENE